MPTYIIIIASVIVTIIIDFNSQIWLTTNQVQCQRTFEMITQETERAFKIENKYLYLTTELRLNCTEYLNGGRAISTLSSYLGYRASLHKHDEMI